MSTQPAAQAETAATPSPATPLPDSASAAASKFVADKEAKAKEPAPKGPAEGAENAAGAKTGNRAEKPKVRLDPNLVKREREATTALQRAEQLEAKVKPLTEALAKKDIKAALHLLAADHGVTFADFVEVLKGAGDEDESLDQKAARIARETIDAAKAEDAKKADAEAKAKADEETKAIEARVEKVKGLILEKAESDPGRWDLASLDPVVTRDDKGQPIVASDYAWRLIEANHEATGKAMSFEEALDVVEGKLRAKRDTQRAKTQSTRDQSATGQTRNEAGGQTNGGRADEPRINNRTTSGAPGVRPARDPNEPVRFDKSAINDAIARALPHLANA